MGSSQSKTTQIKYYDGSSYTGEVNQFGQQHGKGQIQYANKNSLKGKFYEGDCVKAQIKYNNGNQYHGQLEKFLYHGYGILKTPQMRMEGLFRQGKFLYGQITHKDYNYHGSLVNMKKNGLAKLHIIKQDVYYQGYFKDDLFQGTGELRTPDQEYQGQFKKGKYEGVGVLNGFKDGSLLFIYEGQFKYGKLDGQGKITYLNNDIYEGQFYQGHKHGNGVYKYSNGDVYKGKFSHDLKNDHHCQIHFNNNTSTYIGGIKDGKYHGKGVLTSENRTKYEGQFSQGGKNGKGILTTPEYQYLGDFLNDQKHGYGIIKFTEGQVFQGEFFKGLKNGRGKLTRSNQTIFATYQDDIRNGPYQIISAKQNEYYEKGSYLNGKRHGHIFIRKGNHQRTVIYDNGNQDDEYSQN